MVLTVVTQGECLLLVLVVTDPIRLASREFK